MKTSVTTGARTLPELIQERAAGDPDRVALCVDGGPELTLGAWCARARPVAAGLAERGIRPGDRVGLWFAEDDWIDYAVAAVGVYLAGGAVVGLSPRLGAAEAGRRMTAADVAGLLHGEQIAPPSGPGWSASVGAVAVRAGSGRAPAEPGPQDLVEILHTSGTTGPAKAVTVTHANLTFGRTAAVDRVVGGGGVLTPVPLGTNAGHSAILAALTGSTTVHVLSSTDAPAVIEVLGRLRLPTAILPAPLAAAVAVVLRRDVRQSRKDLSTLSELRAVFLGSAPVHAATVDRLRALLPGTVFSIGYGSTEASPAFTRLAPQDLDTHPGSVGVPEAGVDIQIRDSRDGHDAAGVGEIWLRSPAPSRGYLDAAASAATFQDGWTRTGDLGRVDADGHLYFFDRAAHALPGPDGTPISSFAIEDALLWHPAVADAAVVADASGPPGAVAAFVEPAGSGPRPSAAELRAFAADRLPAGQVPSTVVFLDALPRGPLGKVVKRRLPA